MTNESNERGSIGTTLIGIYAKKYTLKLKYEKFFMSKKFFIIADEVIINENINY
jgi:hypothetical protein